MKYKDYILVLLLACISGCGPHGRIAVDVSTQASERFVPGGTLWIGSRSAAVLASPAYPRMAPQFESALTAAGFVVVADQAQADSRAYIWFGKRGQRREQFSNVTDNISITTEYTWGLSLEISSWTTVPPAEMYFSSVETAVWCQAIDGVLDELVTVLLDTFSVRQRQAGSVQVTLGSGGC